jgi:hypothetical protein
LRRRSMHRIACAAPLAAVRAATRTPPSRIIAGSCWWQPCSRHSRRFISARPPLCYGLHPAVRECCRKVRFPMSWQGSSPSAHRAWPRSS